MTQEKIINLQDRVLSALMEIYTKHGTDKKIDIKLHLPRISMMELINYLKSDKTYSNSDIKIALKSLRREKYIMGYSLNTTHTEPWVQEEVPDDIKNFFIIVNPKYIKFRIKY